jgi:hypothetical protein
MTSAGLCDVVNDAVAIHSVNGASHPIPKTGRGSRRGAGISAARQSNPVVPEQARWPAGRHRPLNDSVNKLPQFSTRDTHPGSLPVAMWLPELQAR